MKERRKGKVQSEAEDEQGAHEYEEEYETDYQTDYTQYGSDTEYESEYQSGDESSTQEPQPPHQPWVEDNRWETEHDGFTVSVFFRSNYPGKISDLDRNSENWLTQARRTFWVCG